jgi:hypothetical protein
MQVKRKFFLMVGIISKDLGPSLKREAVKHARAEKKATVKKGDRVALYKQTKKHGTVYVSF